MADLCRLLQVHHLKTSVYNPHTDNLIEWFNQTLKQMLQQVVADGGHIYGLALQNFTFQPVPSMAMQIACPAAVLVGSLSCQELACSWGGLYCVFVLSSSKRSLLHTPGDAERTAPATEWGRQAVLKRHRCFWQPGSTWPSSATHPQWDAYSLKMEGK